MTGLFTYPDVMVVCGESQFEFDRRDVSDQWAIAMWYHYEQVLSYNGRR